MTLSPLSRYRLRWINLPGALLMALLQRTPVLRVVSTAEELLVASPIGATVRSAIAAAASLGAMHALVGATQFVVFVGNTQLPINRPSEISATVGQAIAPVSFTYTGTPTPPVSFLITGSLPPGLAFIPLPNASGVVNSSTPVINGTPTQAGVFTIGVQGFNSPNATGNTNGVLVPITFNVAAAPAVPPTIVAQPANQTVEAGRSVALSVVASGTPAPTFQWRKDGTAIPGATSGSFSIAIVQPADAGNYSVIVSNSAGSVSSGIATLTVTVNPLAPVFTAQPQPQKIATGNTVVFSAAARAASRYQWQRNRANLPGETNATLVLSGAAVVASNYAVVASNADGATTSAAASLTVIQTTDAGRLVNLSVLTVAGAGSKILTVGAVIAPFESTGSLPLIVRAVGPTLAQFDVVGLLADPIMNLFAAGNPAPIGANDDWGGAAALASAFAGVGAFALPPDSRDSAILRSGPGAAPGGYTVQATGKDGASGRVIAEIYDASGSARTPATPRLINLSSLTEIDNGDTLAMGFVLGGQTAKTVLIRAVGPSLGAFNVAGVMLDPRLELFDNSTGQKIGENDDWGGGAQLVAAAASVAAFALAGPTTRDSVVLVTLPPGQYSARVNGAAGAGGTVIIEAYEVP
ncbi:MAG: immunoglobulin domain-containing protein [Verrucomicrobia bacterium]|nr:immunoglobulin domain-containing protein [Verrucomicrobiota bacterium]